jgi:hypothetical protein
MSEEERRRKIILDSLEALNQVTGCMRNTFIVLHGGGAKLSDKQVEDFREACDAVADRAAVIQRHCSGT